MFELEQQQYSCVLGDQTFEWNQVINYLIAVLNLIVFTQSYHEEAPSLYKPFGFWGPSHHSSFSS